jgi:hypothetical protein
MDGLGEASRSSPMQNLHNNEKFVFSEANKLPYIREVHSFWTQLRNWCLYLRFSAVLRSSSRQITGYWIGIDPAAFVPPKFVVLSHHVSLVRGSTSFTLRFGARFTVVGDHGPIKISRPLWVTTNLGYDRFSFCVISCNNWRYQLTFYWF